jgi:hypothetical protein
MQDRNHLRRLTSEPAHGGVVRTLASTIPGSECRCQGTSVLASNLLERLHCRFRLHLLTRVAGTRCSRCPCLIFEVLAPFKKLQVDRKAQFLFGQDEILGSPV